ncbi:MAG: hypothetical protein HY530_03825 [Chloroflexi bacterium]|nr:hypothetical protein [Chloroflexota bacterium]
MFDPTVATKIIAGLGLVNLVMGLTIFFSCRCMPGSKLGTMLMKYRTYQRFYKLHCYFWRVFWSSVMVHGTLAIIFFGLPF